jgi:hypothetical protein
MEADGPDVRFEFMGTFVQKTLKLKPEKWSRLMTQDDYKVIINEFMDEPVPVVLIISEIILHFFFFKLITHSFVNNSCSFNTISTISSYK